MDEQDKDACWSVSRMKETRRSPPVKTCRLLRGAYFINPRSAAVVVEVGGGEAKRGANCTTGGPPEHLQLNHGFTSQICPHVHEKVIAAPASASLDGGLSTTRQRLFFFFFLFFL